MLAAALDLVSSLTHCSNTLERKEVTMKSAMTGLAAAAAAMSAGAECIRFDEDPIGSIPPGWSCGVTGTAR